MNAHTLDKEARGFAAAMLLNEASLLDVLITMRRTRAFVVLNFSSIYDYATRGLKLSEMQAYYFKAVAEKSESVPELKQAIDDKKLTVSQARRIVSVITPENQASWIEKAATLPQKELEREVTVVNPKAHVREKIKPVAPTLSEMRVGVTPEIEAKLNRLKDVLSQKLRRAATLAEVIAWMADVTLDKHDPLVVAERVLAKKAKRPAKSRATPGRNPIPKAVQHEVRLRDRGQCTEPGCLATRHVDFHHIIFVKYGGLNTVENLRLLCAAHHAQLHLGEGDDDDMAFP